MTQQQTIDKLELMLACQGLTDDQKGIMQRAYTAGGDAHELRTVACIFHITRGHYRGRA